MRWIPETSPQSGFDLPKLLGIYEKELAPCMEQACQARFPLIVDVGAAEGYYAVGLAMRNPETRVVAFEMQERERSELTEKARLNEVSPRIELRGKCEPADLEAALSGSTRSFVICDTEGYESKLLDPALVPSLAGATILVELHEFVVPGVGAQIEQWYADTHRISRIWQEDRNAGDFPFTSAFARFLPEAYFRWAVGESRPERMSWLWLEPKDPRG